MSKHKSLKKKRGGQIHKTVLDRYTRIEILKAENKWDEKAFGIPKVRSEKIELID